MTREEPPDPAAAVLPPGILRGRRAFLTGGSRETGPHVARAFARAGCDVALTYLSARAAGERVAAGCRALGVRSFALPLDLRDPASIRHGFREAERRLSGIDILVNHAGTWTMTPFSDLPEGLWDDLMDGNPKGAWLLANLAAPRMRRRGWGRILNVAATSAFKREHSIYGLAKAAMIRLSQAQAIELGPEITVNALVPGLIEAPELDPGLRRRRVAITPTRRLVTRDAIAEFLVAMCTPLFDHVTGEAIVMDGGMVTALR